MADKLIRGKGLSAPTNSSGRTNRAAARTSGRSVSERRCYEALLEIERCLGDRVAPLARLSKASCFKKSRKPKQTDSGPGERVQLTSANDVVQFGIQRGWIL